MTMRHICYIFLPNISPYYHNTDSNSVHHGIHFMLAISEIILFYICMKFTLSYLFLSCILSISLVSLEFFMDCNFPSTWPIWPNSHIYINEEATLTLYNPVDNQYASVEIKQLSKVSKGQKLSNKNSTKTLVMISRGLKKREIIKVTNYI